MVAVLSASGLCAGWAAGGLAIRDVDLEVHAGELVCLLGANGAGKTTTLMALAGELMPAAGVVAFGDRTGHRSLHRRAREGLGLLTDDKGVFHELTVRDNLRLGRGSVEGAIEHFPELAPHLDRRCGLLSGGQQQMVGLGRLLAAQPSVVLADELSMGLAPQVVESLLRTLRGAADKGAAILVVEQHVPLALRWSDRAYVLRRGRIARHGTAAELSSASGGDDLTRLYLEGAS